MDSKYIESFRFHKLDLTETTGSQARGTCPFCNKPGHFYVRTGTSNGKSVDGMWKCQLCQEHGNIYTFLRRLVEVSCGLTTDEDYEELWEKKKIPKSIAKRCKVCKSVIDGVWMVPTCRLNDKKEFAVVNIHRWWESRNKLLGTTGLDLSPLGRQFLSEKDVLWISEGHWDWLIMEHVFRATKQRSKVNILGVPGAGSFSEKWLKFLEGHQQINIVFDGDHKKKTKAGNYIQPGMDGMLRLSGMIQATYPDTEVRIMNWPDGLADGFDVRDLFMQELGNE